MEGLALVQNLPPPQFLPVQRLWLLLLQHAQMLIQLLLLGHYKNKIINIIKVSMSIKMFVSPIHLHFLFFDFIFFCLWILVLLEQVFSCFSLSFLKHKFNKSSHNILSKITVILYFLDSKRI